MNLKYIIVGVVLLAIGVFIAFRELKAFFAELKDAQENRILVWVKGIIDSLFLGGLGFAGMILFLVGLAFIVSELGML